MKRTIVFILLGSALVASCKNGSQGDGSSKEVNIYSNEKSNPDKISVRFFNQNKEIPYISIEKSCEINNPKYSCTLNEGVYTIENPKNQETMKINGETGEVIYKDFSKFQYLDKFENQDYIEEFKPADNKYLNEKVNDKSSYTPCSEYKLNLADFDLKPIKYENSYYLPISIVQQLLCYSNGAYYFDNNENIYYVYANEDDEILFNKNLSARSSYSRKFYEYCFNEFSLNTELFYGLKGFSRKMRSTLTEHKYFANGVKQEFASYKDDIINSTSVSAFDKKMATMVNKTMDDGGHTYAYYGSFGTDRKNRLETPEEVKTENKISEEYTNKRKNSPDKDSINNLVYTYDTDSDGKQDVGYLTFNGFYDKTKIEEKEYDIREIFRKYNANKFLNPNASDYDSTKYAIKDVIVDISGNGGGSVCAEGFALSWMCGGLAVQALKATNGSGYSSFVYKYDVDGDGKFTNADYLPDTVNVYLLFSGCTYSAANSLAYDSYLYNRKQGVRKIQLMGSLTGGGACSVTGTKLLSSGFSYRLSNNSVSVDPKDHKICCENGVEPDDGLSLTYDQMVDRTSPNGINQLVVKRRK